MPPHTGEHLTRRGHVWRSLLTSGPAVFWLSAFLLVPLLAVACISFLSRGAVGEVVGPLNLDNYKRFLGFGSFGFDPLYPVIMLRSLALGTATALFCVLAGFPLAFFIAGLPARWKNAGLTLVIIPLWTNLLIRTYAWQIIMAPDGWAARIAAAIGLSAPGAPLYPSLLAVYVGMVCDFLPFLVLPLYASVEKLDWSLAEAAMDLGANGWAVFRHAILPQVMPGLVAGTILVLIPATGQFVIPDLLGGSKSMMLGNAIQMEFGASRDWPFGSAIAILAMGFVMAGLWIYARTATRKGEPDLI